MDFEAFPRSSSFEDLDANPPSPILGASDHPVSLPSGDISIMLDGIVIDSGIVMAEGRSSYVLDSESPTSRRTSFGTIGSGGTFGPRGKSAFTKSLRSSVSSYASTYASWVTAPQSLSPKDTASDVGRTYSANSAPSIRTSRSMSPVDGLLSVPPSPTGSLFSSPGKSTFSFEGSLSPRASSPIDRLLGRHRRSNVSAISPSSSVNSSSRSSTYSISSTQSDSSFRRRLRGINLLMPSSPTAPAHLEMADVESSTVQILIDQEGFRTVTPSFRFGGYSNKLDPTGTVEFLPTERQSFHFHHAFLEGVPILRRVMLNGKETIDYISRQANLVIKNNGVYTVHGIEDVHGKAGPDAHKLHWKFDYVVGERKAGSLVAQVSLEGEKTLTPLSFACSSALLAPQQGKKVKLMHIVKKTVVAKLMAEKVDPSALLARSSKAPSDGQKASAPSSPIKFTLGSPAIAPTSPIRYMKSMMSGFHRRAQSQASNRTDPPSPKTISPTKSAFAGITARRLRRASSAHERSRPAFPQHRPTHSVDGPTLTSASERIGRPIIPPGELKALIETLEKERPAYRRPQTKAMSSTPSPGRHLT